jgi:hypothetical protein
MLPALLHWLDADPLRYHGAAWVALGGAAGLAFAPCVRWGWIRSAWLFALALLLSLTAFRWPTVLFNQPLGNPDEGQLIAGAMALAHDPVPFRSVDGHTSGPLTPLALVLLARLTGMAIDFTAARWLGLICAWVIVVATWRILRAVCDEIAARILAIPALLVFAVTFDTDLTQLISEPVPAALLAGAGWALAPLLNEAGALSWRRLLLAGVLCGAAPLAKPQAAPLTVVLILAGGVLLWGQIGSRRDRLRAIGLFGGAVALPMAGLFVILTATGMLGEFFTSYVVANIDYAQHPLNPLAAGFASLISSLRDVDALGAFGLAGAVAVLPAAAAGRLFSPAHRRLLFVAAALLTTAVATVIAPGRAYHHYLYFLIGPCALWLAAVVAGVLELAAADRIPWFGSRIVPWIWTAWALGCVAPTTVNQITARPAELGKYSETDAAAAHLRALLAPYVVPNDTMSVWGWAPEYYPQSGLRPATHEAHTFRQLSPGRMQAYSRARYLTDLQQNRPAVFIDDTGPGAFGFADAVAYGFETFPELRRLVTQEYQLIGRHRQARVFVRRDLAGRHPEP